VAMLRCPRLSGVVLSALLLGVAPCGPSCPAAGPDAAASPRGLLRLPKWMDRLTGRDSATPAPAEAAKNAAPAPQDRPTAADQAPAGTAPGIAATPRSTAEGKPGRSLLRSRFAAPVDTRGSLLGAWGELASDLAARAQPGAAQRSAPAGAETFVLGPDRSVLAASGEDTGSTATVAVGAAPLPPEEGAEGVTSAVVEPPAPAPLGDLPPTPPTSLDTPVAATPDEVPTLTIDPASFQGITPGTSTRGEVEAVFGLGTAFTREDGSNGLFWAMEPFERVEMTFDGDVCSAIRVKLVEPLAVDELAEKLEIGDLRTVSILDEQGISIGEVFPERGIVFSLKPGTRSALAMMLEPLDPEAFVLRAEGEMETHSAHALADLTYAIELDPRHLRAHRLLLVLLAEQGRWQQALKTAAATEAVDPVDVWTRLKHASILVALERFVDARTKVEEVRDEATATPLVKAQAERMLGRIALEEPTADYARAVGHFDQAIRAGLPLLTNRSPSVQTAAREVLLDAHLGMAIAISRGKYRQKPRVIPKWIQRADAMVAEVPADDPQRAMLELQLCRGALAAAAGSAEAIEPLPWVKRLLAARDRLGAGLEDSWRRRQIDWEAGHGLADAIAAAQKRGEAADMLANATLTAAYLERGAEQRELTDRDRRSLGDIYFRIGVLHGIQQGDHATAVVWFDKVVPLWESNAAFGRDGTSGRLGESLVSMAISYWNADRREEAVRLSRQGVKLMEGAVEQRQIEEKSLAVAYGNLSTMYAEQGDDFQAKAFAEMASRVESTAAKLQ